MDNRAYSSEQEQSPPSNDGTADPSPDSSVQEQLPPSNDDQSTDSSLQAHSPPSNTDPSTNSSEQEQSPPSNDGKTNSSADSIAQEISPPFIVGISSEMTLSLDPSTNSSLQVHSPPSNAGATNPPPKYDSIFGELRNARQQSSGTLAFLKKVSLAFLSTIGCTICLAVFLALPIASIVIGAKYRDDCTIEDKIPIYLIVAGAFGVFRNLLGLYNQCKRQRDFVDDDEIDHKKTTFERCIDCFLIAWSIFGNIWVYTNYQPVYDNPASPDYCDKTLYLFAFWMTTASYIIIGLFCVCMCCIAFCSLLLE